MNLLETSTIFNAYLYTFLLLGASHDKGKNDKLEELHLGMEHQELVLAYI